MPPFNAPPLPRSAAVYIRVSTEDQAELSPETQLAEVEAYAAREGVILLRDHIYIDAGISGKKAERRPEFMRMIAAAKEKDCPFSVILVWKYSRFARNQEESVFYKSVLRSKCGIDVCSITEPLVAGPFGSLIERIIEWMDEFYSIRLSQEVKRSMSVNAQRGRLQCPAAYGYRAVGGGLLPVEEEARMVRLIFEGFLAGKGFCAIARELNVLGARTHRGGRWEGRTVEYILRNPVYIGRLRWNPTGHTHRNFSCEDLIIADAGHQPLISHEVWEAVQRRLDAAKALGSPHSRPGTADKRWLTGLVHCAACGAALVFTKPHYYRCGSYVRGRCGCSQHIRAQRLEEAILFRLEADAQAAGTLTYERCQAGQDGGEALWCVQSALRQLESKKERLQEAYLAGALELADFAAAREKLKENEASLRRELDLLQKRAASAGDSLALQEAASGPLRIPEASPEQRSNAARAVIEACVFDKAASTLTITYRLVLPA